jgi:hypothetical protein
LRLQSGKSGLDGRESLRFKAMIFADRHIPQRLTGDDDLRTGRNSAGRIGFMSVWGALPQAAACRACASQSPPGLPPIEAIFALKATSSRVV